MKNGKYRILNIEFRIQNKEYKIHNIKYRTQKYRIQNTDDKIQATLHIIKTGYRIQEVGGIQNTNTEYKCKIQNTEYRICSM